jgi:predicted DNA-binding protein (MmcQ/YjbR family)
MGHLEKLRAIRETLPDTSERPSHGAPAFFYREKKCFLMFMDNHHDDGRHAIWCAGAPGAQEMLVAADSGKFFRPPYVGHRGWLGVLLHGDVDWDEIAGIVEDAYDVVAR